MTWSRTLDALPIEPDLLAGRAYLLSELNQTAAALDAYAALFAERLSH